MRGIIFASLVTIWGIRLTYNYWRKGGYKKGEEDYRWAVVKKRYGDVMFQLLNATFIAPF
jgi:steroid 5-alpha reductase family enzyme